MMPKQEDILERYKECCTSYHRIDDFRAKLLGFLPLITGAGIFVSLSSADCTTVAELPSFALFGFVVTLGLLVYELKGIQKCTQLIYLGRSIEKSELERQGQFTEIMRNPSSFINEPVASAIIYSMMLAAWSYVGVYPVLSDCKVFYVVPITIFIIFFYLIYKFWERIVAEEDNR